MPNYEDVSIDSIIFEFASYSPDADFDEDDDIEDETNKNEKKPNEYQIRLALEHAIFINRTDIVDRIVREYNPKLLNNDLHVGLSQAIENEDCEAMKYWFKYKVCPRYEHFEEIINNDNNQEILNVLLKYLKSLGNKGIPACYRIMKALCNLQIPDKKYIPPKETILPRKLIIKEIAKIMIDPFIYYSSEAIYKETMNETINYKKILKTIEYWEYDGYDDFIQDWVRDK